LRLTRETLPAAFQAAAATQASGDLAAAARRWREIVTAAPDLAEGWRNFADVLTGLGRFPEAANAYRKALALRPDAQWALWGLAGFLQKTGRWAEAEPLFARALAIGPASPQLSLAYSHVLLGLGDFARGWPLYESRKGLAGQGAEPPLLPNEWQGEPLAGKRLLVWPEQGFGDQIQFVRYSLALQAQGADVTLACPPELHPLFAELPLDVVTGEAALTRDPPDYWTLALSAPGRLGVGMADLTGEPYLRAPADRRAKWRGQVPPGSVGVAWRGRASHPNDAHRSLPSAQSLEPLREAGANLVDLTEPRGDFADLAAIVEQLDLVITVDTALGHLAGALGKPCWVLLPWFRQDWRWFQDREDSPWYAGHRLFRQPAAGDWRSVLRRVAKALAER
jgi:tetratricopeptide (TPR) repeat protein